MYVMYILILICGLCSSKYWYMAIELESIEAAAIAEQLE